jgi:hypothetical protein
LAAVRLPAWDIGPPYLARFSAVSGTGPLVSVVTVALAPVAVSLVVTEVEVAVPVSAVGAVVVSAVGAGLVVVVVVVVDWPAGNVGSAVGAGVALGSVVVVVVEGAVWSVACAKAAPLIRADAATAVKIILSFMGRASCSLLKAPPL